MPNLKQPSISVLIPTLNAEKCLKDCLSSVAGQDYSPDKVEIVIGDGGSKDRTIIIGEQYGAKIYHNPLQTAESGKAVAFFHAKNDLVVLIDSDNILPDKNWFKRMVEPFTDKEIVGSEPWEYTYRSSDGFIDRYCAMLGMNDPVCLFLGNYDRQSLLTGRWTDLPVKTRDEGGWLKVFLRTPQIPTIGANGTMFRRSFLSEKNMNSDYLFDVDILSRAAEKKEIAFAKVKIGIVHLYCGSDVKKFIRKQKRRIKDFLYYQKSGIRKYPWGKQNKIGLLTLVLYCVTIIPLFFQAAKGFLKKRDPAWAFHPLACCLTLLIYSSEKVKYALKINNTKMSREKWRQ